MTRRANIFLADLLLGLSKLQIRDPVIAREVLRMLSLDRLEQSAATSIEGAFAAAAAAPPRPTEPAVSPPSPPPPTSLPPALTEQRETTLRQLAPPSESAAPPGWLVGVKTVARPSGPTPVVQQPEPLFPRAQTRGVLTAALSTWNADGPLDIARVVDTLAELRPLRELPLEATATIRRGVQILVDTGLGMGPFRLDVDQIVERIESIVANDQMRVFYFTGCPSRDCAARGEDVMKRWVPPPRGTPVFLLSDLGIGAPIGAADRAGVEEWLDFAEQVRTAGCTLSALVPYGPRRWPRPLTRALRIVHWDRRTTAAIVRRGLVNPGRIAR